MRPPQRPARPLTVSMLTGTIQQMLESQLHDLWIEGELSSVKQNHSGHVYLSIKDSKARLDCVIWRADAARIVHRPAIGEQIRLHGRIAVYPPRGAYQLIADQLEPAGLGARRAAVEALKAKLASEGLFHPQRKRRPPFLPRRIGLVTSPTGAARRDIEAVLARRAPQIPLLLYPARTQGFDAAPDLAEGIRRVARAPGVEVVILARGGGSAEDLAAFDEEAVARAIAACPVPVITGIGHQTDLSVADLVADLQTPTPSAAAEAAAPHRDQLRQALANVDGRLHYAMGRGLAGRRHLLDAATRGLALGVGPHRLRLERALNALHARAHQRGRAESARLQALARRLHARDPARVVAQVRNALSRAEARLEALGRQLVATRRIRQRSAQAALEVQAARLLVQRKQRLAQASARLAALSPLAVLERGYSVIRHEGTVLRSADQVAPGEVVDVLLRRGRLRATVLETTQEESS